MLKSGNVCLMIIPQSDIKRFLEDVTGQTYAEKQVVWEFTLFLRKVQSSQLLAKGELYYVHFIVNLHKIVENYVFEVMKIDSTALVSRSQKQKKDNHFVSFIIYSYKQTKRIVKFVKLTIYTQKEVSEKL